MDFVDRTIVENIKTNIVITLLHFKFVYIKSISGTYAMYHIYCICNTYTQEPSTQLENGLRLQSIRSGSIT